MKLFIIVVIAGVVLAAALEGARRARIGRAMERSFEAMRSPAAPSVPSYATAEPRRVTIQRPSSRWEPREAERVARAS
jgi:hypothetical protein